MIRVFNSPFKVTQKFGVNRIYYAQFDLEGHEGLDLVPTGFDWSVYSLPYRGQVVKDIDMESKGGAYGIHCTIWYPEIGEAWMYCHLRSNSTYEGQQLDPETNIGQMGDTGNTEGAHLHINRFKVNSLGYRLNRNNGFLGGIDPLPFLELPQMEEPAPAPDDPQPMDTVRMDVHEALTGKKMPDDTRAWRKVQGLNTRDLILDYMNNDDEVKARWRTIPLTLADYSTRDLLTEVLKKLKP